MPIQQLLPMTQLRQLTILVMLIPLLLQQAVTNSKTIDYENKYGNNRKDRFKQWLSVLSTANAKEVLLYLRTSSIDQWMTRNSKRVKPMISESHDDTLDKAQIHRFLQFGDNIPTAAPSELSFSNSDSPSTAPSLQPNKKSGDNTTSDPDMDTSSAPPSASPTEPPGGDAVTSTVPSRAPATSPESPQPSIATIITVFPTGDYSGNKKNDNDDQDVFPPPTTSLPKPPSSTSSAENDSDALSSGGKFSVILLAGILFLFVCTCLMRGSRKKHTRGHYHRSANGMRDLELTRWNGHDDDDGLL